MPFTVAHAAALPGSKPAADRIIQALAVALGIGLAALVNDAPAQAQQPGAGTSGAAGQVPVTPDAANPNQPLSEKLDKSGGVLRPPAGIDPGIHAPAPEPDPRTTPVIPPPGTPGGDQNIQPK
jgi:hypothetical protein